MRDIGNLNKFWLAEFLFYLLWSTGFGQIQNFLQEEEPFPKEGTSEDSDLENTDLIKKIIPRGFGSTMSRIDDYSGTKQFNRIPSKSSPKCSLEITCEYPNKQSEEIKEEERKQSQIKSVSFPIIGPPGSRGINGLISA